MNRIFCNIKNVFTVTIDQFNASLLIHAFEQYWMCIRNSILSISHVLFHQNDSFDSNFAQWSKPDVH